MVLKYFSSVAFVLQVLVALARGAYFLLLEVLSPNLVTLFREIGTWLHNSG